MKTLKNKYSNTSYKTMTVGELREKLNSYPDDMPVLATWEGLFVQIDSACFSVSKVSHIRHDCVVIDVDQL